jgi:ABC-type transport system involved in cytochrome c biogenesis ATPase subunit
MPSTVLRAKDLGFAYPQRRLFQALSFELPPGLSLIRGGDGSGKTTLLRLLAGDLPSDGGALWLRGVSLSEQPFAYRSKVFRVDHQVSGLDQVTPEAYLAELSARHPDFDHAGLPALINGLGLEPHWQKPMYMLSTGSKRKVWPRVLHSRCWTTLSPRWISHPSGLCWACCKGQPLTQSGLGCWPITRHRLV